MNENIKLDTYEYLYSYLSDCFLECFGNGNRRGLMSMHRIANLVNSRKQPDSKNNMPGNSLIEVPTDLYGELKDTYVSRDDSYVSGTIGCAETSEEQLYGITNTVLLMYLSNQLSKEYKHKYNNELDIEKMEELKNNENKWLNVKDISLADAIATTYVLSKTEEEYNNYFSYGSRIDNEGKNTFVMDLPYIGQICVHFGWEKKKEVILQRASDTVKTILEKKLELGQITEEQLNKVISELELNGVLPEYEGKLYEFVGSMPIEYIGENIKKYRKMIGNKLPEDITSEDIEKLKNAGLNERELYYFFIKIGASKDVLNEISIGSKNISLQSIQDATEGLTLGELNIATEDIKRTLIASKGKETLEI